MSVSNGQLANETTFNTSFMSREVDTTTIGKVDLLNAAAESGPDVENVQREINSNNAFSGRPAASAHDATPVWVSNDVGASTDDLKERAEALSEKFHETTGHKHTGVAGDAPQIDSDDIASVRLKGSFVRATDLIGVTGSSVVVTTEMSGKTPSTGTTVKGVVVTAPENKLVIRDDTAATEGDELKDAGGDLIYGRITEAAGVWTLSFYTDEAGVETAHSFGAAQDIQWYYQELFNPITDAPVYSELARIPSDNATQDVVDASATQRGLVSTGAQSLAGDKTLTGDLALQATYATEREDVASAATIAALSSAKSFVKITGSTATDIQGITAGGNGQILTLHNGASAVVTVKHQDAGASAANRIKLEAGTDLEINPDSSAEFIYDTNQSRWVIKSGAGSGGGGALDVTGSRGTPQAIVAGTGIAFTGTDARQLWFIEGSGGHVDVSANPQIAVATIVGQELILVGRDDDATVTLEDGTGLSLNGAWVGGYNSVLGLFWDGAEWVEIFRR